MDFSVYIERLQALMTPQRFADYEPPDCQPGSPEALREAYAVACGEFSAAAEEFDTRTEGEHLSHYPHPPGLDLADYLRDLAAWIAEVRCLIRSVLGDLPAPMALPPGHPNPK
jgi:hypothetical protein